MENNLKMAVQKRKLEKIKKFLNTTDMSAPSFASKGYQLLCKAIKYKDIEIAKFLINSGCKVISRNEKKSSDVALHLAININNEEIVKMLLSKSLADINKKYRNGSYGLHVAVEKNSPRILKILLKNHAYVDCRDKKFNTPLHLAARNNTEMCKLLIKYDANVNAKDAQYEIPSHIAMLNFNKDAALLLLKYGSDFECYNQYCGFEKTFRSYSRSEFDCDTDSESESDFDSKSNSDSESDSNSGSDTEWFKGFNIASDFYMEE